jgi:gamma-glutamyltranspeptidase/glutathione hydrolase
MKMILSLFFLIFSGFTFALELAKFKEGFIRSKYEAQALKFMITTQGEYTSRAAKLMIESGGNIYDAFLAATLVISVERPHSTGIGGGGFAVIYNSHEKKFYAFDFRERAPLKSNKDIFIDQNGQVVPEKSITGPFAVGVPGLIKGALHIHSKWGKLSRKKVFQPAIDLAKNGFPIYPALAEALIEEAPRLIKFPSSKKIFFKDDHVLKVGEILIQKDLAQTLERISLHGEHEFYQGETAQLIVKELNHQKGLMTLDDLKKYQVKERTPVEGEYRGYQVVSMPPPSSGGVHVLQILNTLEDFPLNQWGPLSFKSIHATASAMQMAFADRAQYLGDSDFVQVPVRDLISKTYAKKLSQRINFKTKINSADFPKTLKEIYESNETTHFSLMDHEENVIVSTQTINGWFGSALVASGTGIVLNNEMDDFATHVGGSNMFGAIGGKNNLVEPYKTPLSSMSPTIVMKNKKPFLALGTPSGTRILTCVTQTILNVIDYKLPLFEAVALKRFHHQWYPERIHFEEPIDLDVERQLKKMGHQLHHESLGCKIQAIMKVDKKLHGVSDPREEGMALGL